MADPSTDASISPSDTRSRSDIFAPVRALVVGPKPPEIDRFLALLGTRLSDVRTADEVNTQSVDVLFVPANLAAEATWKQQFAALPETLVVGWAAEPPNEAIEGPHDIWIWPVEDSALIQRLQTLIWWVQQRRTARNQREAQNRLQARFDLLCTEAVLPAVEWDDQLRITSWNHAVAELFDLPEEQAIGQSVVDVLFANNAGLTPAELRSGLTYRPPRPGESVHRVTVQHTVHGRDFTCRWTLAPLFDGDDQLMGISAVAVTLDGPGSLAYVSTHDMLTGLPNRMLFLDRLGRSLSRARRQDSYRFAVVVLGLERFKLVNDSLGHRVADRLLREIAKRLQKHLRSSDTVARLSGDEFIVLAEDVGHLGGALIVAERLQDAFAEPFVVDGHTLFQRARVGIVLSNADYERPEHMVRDANVAMDRAKALGPSAIEVFHEAMHREAMRTFQLESELRHALANQELRLFYQPIIDLKSGQIAGFEALIRWQSPERGMVSPLDFIPFAEETGLIIPIGRWVMEEACRQALEWSQQFPDYHLTISVNLSARQFTQPDLLEQVRGVLRDSGLPANQLCLEITESVVMDRVEETVQLLRTLKELDVRLQMDDFGTGYSSLSYLHRFPLDTIKVDRSFVSRMGPTGENRDIVRAILQLTHSLRMSATAEGVETAEQLALLREMGCQKGQGYFFAKPLPAPDAAALLSRKPTW